MTGPEKSGSDARRWCLLFLLSFFLHASLIGALVFVPERSVSRFTSSMDFSVIKNEKRELLPAKEEKTGEPKEHAGKPEEYAKRREKARPAPLAEEKDREKQPPLPPSVKKFEMSESSFSGDGTWGMKAEIGTNRIGSFSGSKEAGPSGPEQEVETGPEPVPKKRGRVVIKEKPRVIREVTIPYPSEARRLEIEGDAILLVTINEKGNVVNVEILSDPGGGLGEAAARALKRFLFAPALSSEGKAVPYKIKYIYSFVLD